MSKELNLVIVWEHGRTAQEEIIEDLNKDFKICEVLEVSWSKEKFANNLTRFYGQKLPSGSHKEKHCGNGSFILITFIDENPVYHNRDTSRGPELVNTNVFDKKTLYRQWTGGGHKIHTTNGKHETAHDLMLLLGQEVDAYIEKFSLDSPAELSPNAIERDLEGASGWNSFSHLFRTANACSNYVVMRNFENLPDSYLINDHGDIDFLAQNAVDFAYILNAKKSVRPFRPNAYVFFVNGQEVPCDIREVGDGYYDRSWQESILFNATRYNGFCIPSDDDYKPMLAYHALVHKVKVSKDYEHKLDLDLEGMFKLVSKFLSEHNYSVTLPKDISVYFHFSNSRAISKSISRVTKYNIAVVRIIRQILLVDIRVKLSKLIR
ncbi:hypothetical protein Fbal_1073 [Ferrimonas balearica DSM 9799]|uniref:Uncharacterized protein n=1 Tax=Ferrimonas balearica (strain DSM 9799 / CCM 4581 / KCTC 23876 / PAT) TaxID=550540 RepID=E1SUU1_FERBD|nr:hypothetical protein [Ferrimonas balearica]ADN75282.1 hypothetical protein Fbal_1073 [Ferrimonas balearica DSM 9799]